MMPVIWCFPFAGASFYSYRPLFKGIEHLQKVKYLELPGRGNRLEEPLLHGYRQILEDVYDRMSGEVHEPFIFYGHSMGAQLAFDMAHLILTRKGLKPQRLIVSGRGAPSVVRMKKRHDLSKPEFITALKNLGGVPSEILNDPEFFSFFEPILRADFEAIENYRYEPLEKLDIPILALLGDEEETTPAEAAAWKEETTAEFKLTMFKGGHFFILEHTQQILDIITEKIR